MWLHPTHYPDSKCTYSSRGHHGCDCMVVGFTTTYAISVYHHWCCEFESSSGRDVQHYVIKFVSDFCWWFFPGPTVSSTNRTDRHDITEILLKMALNTIKQTNKQIIGQNLSTFSSSFLHSDLYVVRYWWKLQSLKIKYLSAENCEQ